MKQQMIGIIFNWDISKCTPSTPQNKAWQHNVTYLILPGKLEIIIYDFKISSFVLVKT